MLLALFFALGVALYLYAIFSTFTLEWHSPEPFLIATLILAGGFGVLLVGYVSVVGIGGTLSLGLAEFVARVTGSKHVVEVTSEKPRNFVYWLSRDGFVYYLPGLIFIVAMVLGWDIHNLHDPRTSIFHPLLHALDVFAKPLGDNVVSYSIDMILPMIVLIAIAGIAPAVALPYFRRFKVTGVNSGPFHTNLLFTIVGFVVGLGAILTLVGLIYEVLWVGKGPYYYHYIIPAMLGLSLHYSMGAFIGRDKSEEMIKSKLQRHSGKRIIRGTVNIQGPPGKKQ
jgi:hypothetical protein